MKNLFIIEFLPILILVVFAFTANAEEIKNISEHEYNFYTGNFDFSDDKQKAILVWLSASK